MKQNQTGQDKPAPRIIDLDTLEFNHSTDENVLTTFLGITEEDTTEMAAIISDSIEEVMAADGDEFTIMEVIEKAFKKLSPKAFVYFACAGLKDIVEQHLDDRREVTAIPPRIHQLLKHLQNRRGGHMSVLSVKLS